jgi:hypothetical protein
MERYKPQLGNWQSIKRINNHFYSVKDSQILSYYTCKYTYTNLYDHFSHYIPPHGLTINMYICNMDINSYSKL